MKKSILIIALLITTSCATITPKVKEKIDNSCEAYTLVRPALAGYLHFFPENIQSALIVLDETLNTLCILNNLKSHP